MNPWELLALAQLRVAAGMAGLADEDEGELRAAAHLLLAHAQDLVELVETW